MFITYVFILSSSILILPSFRDLGVAGQCGECTFLISYWLVSEMADIGNEVCKINVMSEEVVKSNIVLLLDETRAMMGDGRLNIRGRRGNVGATGGTGYTGITGLIGATGATGPSGLTGSRGLPGIIGVRGSTGPKGRRAKRHARFSRGVKKTNKLTKRQTTTSVRNKIERFLYNCPLYSYYFISFANQLDSITSWNGFSKNDELIRLINKFKDIKDLYKIVSQSFKNLKQQVNNDPRFIGAIGATGIHGRTGVIGPAGNTGSTGVMGEKGNSGFPGATGGTGLTGATGATGVSWPG